LGWLSHYRVLSKDYEVLPRNSEAVVYVAMIHLMVRRLAHPSTRHRTTLIGLFRCALRHQQI
jgi:putative transposase